MKYDLSILIPARCEMFLAKTVQDIFEHREGKTQVIVGLDGQWADPPLTDHPDLTIVFYPESIGQRAMTNQLCKISSAKYVMKVDAHCAFDQGFDVKLMADMQDNWTMVPIMRNLHVFNWKCPDGHIRYQGPSGPCKEPGCGKETTRDIVWIAKQSPQSKSYCFDPEPHFQYFGAFCKRPEGKGELTESMSIQGSCFLCTREKYIELDICSEDFPSWGSQGIEVACKTWLSGGRVVINWKTWYSHLFRTQGGDFGFPYNQSGKGTSRAKAYAKELFFKNKWPKQIYPLSWLVEKFWPVQGWTEEQLLEAKKAGAVFSEKLLSRQNSLLSSIPGGENLLTNETFSPMTLSTGNQVPPDAVSFSSVDRTTGIRSAEILGVIDQPKMVRVTTTRVIADNMIEDKNVAAATPLNGGDHPGVRNPVDEFNSPEVFNVAISPTILGTSPVPATSNGVNNDPGLDDLKNGGIVNNQVFSEGHKPIIPNPPKNSKSIIFYTDNMLDPIVANAVQDQLRKISKEKDIPIVSASLKPLDNMGKNIWLDLPWGRLSMWKQILAALENSEAEYVFFCENDVLYHPTHFDFTPTKRDTYFYNCNFWKVRLYDDFAIHYEVPILSGMCCDRELALREYRERVRVLELEGHWRPSMGYEPGTRGKRRGGFFDNPWKGFMSEYPLVDIKHGHNLTTQRWKPEEYNVAENCRNWQESTADKIAGWPNLMVLLKMPRPMVTNVS